MADYYDPYMQVPAQPISQSDHLNAEMMQQQRMENIISQINPENLLTDIEHRIRKMKKNNFTGTWEPIVAGQKEVSPLLISNTISYLSTFLTNNVTFSNFNEQEINKIMNLVISHMITDLIANQDSYGLQTDYAERNRILGIVCQSIYSALKRALKGQEAGKFWKSVSISGDVHNNTEPQKKGLGDFLKLW